VRRLALRSWTALLALFLFLAPLEGFAARASAKDKPAAVKVKKAKKKAVARKPVAKKRVTARKPSTAKKRVARRPTAAKRPVARKSGGKRVLAAKRAPRRVVVAPPLPADPRKLPLDASVAYVLDLDSEEVLLGKNDDDVRPIASLTKLMTGLIMAEARLPLDEEITITGADVDRLKNSSSRLRVGTRLTRAQALHLALMSSENRASHALARTYPGGVRAFVSAMNNKARQLGMSQTRYVDPTGLSSDNRSSARDLAVLAQAAYEQPLLRKYSTSPGYRLAVNGGSLRYVNSNRLVRSGNWDIGLQKTGYISEAGQCLVVQTKVKGRNLVMVFLDSASKLTRIKDAELVRRWLRQHPEVTAQGKGSDAS
jgi:D-alanyl-D-alanine endopeptidase (penicillin-binding protein 7)